MRSASLRFCSGVRPATQVTCTYGTKPPRVSLGSSRSVSIRRPPALRDASSLRGQFCSAVRTVRPAPLHATPAIRAGGLKRRPAVRAENKSGRNVLSAAWTRFRHRTAQDEIQNNADAVRDKNRQQRPHYVTHAATFCVAIHITRKQHIGKQDEREAKRKQELQAWVPHAHVVIAGQCHGEKQQSHSKVDEKTDHPCNRRDYL